MDEINDMNNAVQRIYKSSGAARAFSMALGMLLIAVGVIALSGAFIFDRLENDPQDTLSFASKYADMKKEDMIISFETTVSNLSALLIKSFIFAGIMFTAAKFFKQTRLNGTPFFDKCADKLNAIAVMLISASVLPNLAAFAVMSLRRSFDLGCTFERDFVDGDIALVGVVIFFLAQVFRYGCILQKQSDETL